MSERIRGSYDDTLYKSTYTLLTYLLYWLLTLSTTLVVQVEHSVGCVFVSITHSLNQSIDNWLQRLSTHPSASDVQGRLTIE